ncbi:hypothetical protein P152DRAFT_458140 [Eremomyces bilateralis CBS 781.70]|uniref:RRM domain-containing protein n=1 Tax=Eremomyces bilateralis CBS 781.70 TaxID=1392243 RepID=A0A6G1G4H0_9PEZI|nr:uncharacterized protein P152DRAFT_458140 [Eremomyces bilateralis CBS 781.70]KAF1812967.1 hypothetical protein P152DRAFT_458140 [Eremomyces bilateralis CBS 781.70]
MPKKQHEQAFRDIIDTARKRKHTEALAQKILGSGGRRTSAPGSLESRIDKPTHSQSIGGAVQSGRVGKKARPTAIASTAASKPTARRARVQNLYEDVITADNSALSNIASVRRTSDAIQVKGMGSPNTVIASNFAYGTTAADIESVLLAPENGIDGLLRCRLLSSSPTVIAELTFSERFAAERVIGLFNNKSADNHILHVYFKNERQPPVKAPAAKPTPTRSAAKVLRGPPTGPRRDRERAEAMELDDRTPPKAPRAQVENPRRAPAEFQDGRYGFAEEPAYNESGGGARRGRNYGGGSSGLRSDVVMSDRDQGYRR